MHTFGVIGTGWIADTFIEGALATGRFNLGGIYSRKEESGRAMIGRIDGILDKDSVRVYTDLEGLLRDEEIRAVYIASPNRLHAAQSLRCLEAGKHVIVEKPCAIKPETLERLQAEAKKRGLIYMEAIMLLYQPQLKVLREAVRSLGRVRSAHLDFCQLSSKYAAYERGELPNIFNPAFCTGGLEDLGIYGIYFLKALFGEPESLQIESSFLESGADAAGEILFRMKEDLLVSFSYSKTGQSYRGSEVRGDRGTLMIDLISEPAGIWIRENKGEERLLWGKEEKPVLMGREAVAFADFMEALQAGDETVLSRYQEAGRMALEVCRILEKLRGKAGISFPVEEGEFV